MNSASVGLKIFVLFLFVLPVSAGAQQLKDYFPADTVGVGDTFTLSLVLSKDQSYDDVVFPDSTNIGGDFEIKDRRRYKLNDFTDSLAYDIQYFGMSDTTFPSLPVHLINDTDTLTLRSRQAPLYFRSSLADKDAEFRPLKPIYQFARNWWLWIIGGLAVLLLAWLGYRYYRSRQDKTAQTERKPFKPEPFVDPLDELSKELVRLQRDPSLTQYRDMKTFYTKLTNALRLYYERAYRIHAMESTSSEMMRDLRNLGLPTDLLERVNELLREADMVKFAKFPVTVDDAYQSLDKAQTLLERLRREDSYRIELLRNEHEQRQEQLKQEARGGGSADSQRPETTAVENEGASTRKVDEPDGQEESSNGRSPQESNENESQKPYNRS